MVSQESLQESSSQSSPRISFSADFLDELSFISITPSPPKLRCHAPPPGAAARNAEFEFLSSNSATQQQAMITADELFKEGKLLPFWQMHHAEKLKKISIRTEKSSASADIINNNGGNNKQLRGVKMVEMLNHKDNNNDCRMGWFIDEDPSPRPPKCTVLWKELLRLRKQRPSSTLLSPSSSSRNLADSAAVSDEKKHVRRTNKGLERTRSDTIRIRPVINVPLCTQTETTASSPLPLLSFKKR